MSQTTLLQYEAPCTYFLAEPFYLLSRQYRTGPVYALDWCKSSAPGQQLRARSAFRLGIGSISEDYRNRIAIVGLQDERVLVEDDYTDYPDFVTLVEAHHGYPATSLQWQPAAAASYSWSQKMGTSELMATTGDALRVWEYASDAQHGVSSFVGRPVSGGGHRLTLRAALSGVCLLLQFCDDLLL